MATVEKRGKSYRITVSAGYDRNGKQIRRKKTWTPPPGLTRRQEEKELQRQTVLFEESIKNTGDGHIRLEAFLPRYFEQYANVNLRERTRASYQGYVPRVNAALGHLHLDKITPRHIKDFLLNLTEPGINQSQPGKGLSKKTVKNYFGFLSSVFSFALDQELIGRNPCQSVTMPTQKTESKKLDYYTLEEAQAIVDSLTDAHPRLRAYIILAMFCGFRREELGGLEWTDIDYAAKTIAISRAYLYTPDAGTYTDTTKTRAGQRIGKQQPVVFEALKSWQIEQQGLKKKLGDAWTETGRVFTNDTGTPLHPNSTYYMFKRHCEKFGFRCLGIHALRHLNAAIRISAGADPVTVAAAMGHANASTTLNIYAYEFAQQQAASSEAVADALTNQAKK